VKYHLESQSRLLEIVCLSFVFWKPGHVILFYTLAFCLVILFNTASYLPLAPLCLLSLAIPSIPGLHGLMSVAPLNSLVRSPAPMELSASSRVLTREAEDIVLGTGERITPFGSRMSCCQPWDRTAGGTKQASPGPVRQVPNIRFAVLQGTSRLRKVYREEVNVNGSVRCP